MKEQRVRKIYAKLVQRNEGIKEAVGNIEGEDLGGVMSRAPCRVMMCSAPSL